jgi:hypothetical protein
MNFILTKQNNLNDCARKVEQCIYLQYSDALIKEEIFKPELSYYFFVNFIEFGAELSQKLCAYIKKTDEELCHLASLHRGNLQACYEVKCKEQDIQQKYYLSPHEEAGTIESKSRYEHLYFSPQCTWAGWLHMEWEIGIFAFKSKKYADLFLNLFGRYYVYTIDDLCDIVWQNKMDKKRIKKLKDLYASKMYPLEPLQS